MSSYSCPPLLVLLFNRPHLASCVFERIRKIRPTRLFLAADGPRQAYPGDIELCAATRKLVEQIDWNCELKLLFRERNLGCKQAVSSAITWFFDHVEEGIILEDDCLPDLSFFRFCAELLEIYRGDERIMVVSGDNFQNTHSKEDSSYYFSIHPHCWGWATWRRAWVKYDGAMKLWPTLRASGWLDGWLGDKTAAQYFQGIYDLAFSGRINSWAYVWTFSCWTQHGLSILPAVNLVSNIGFGEHATHTNSSDLPYAELPTEIMTFPLVHPLAVFRNYAADTYTNRVVFGIGNPQSLRARFTNYLTRFGSNR